MVVGYVIGAVMVVVSFLWQYTWGKVIVIIFGLALLGKLTGGGNGSASSYRFKCQNCGKETNDPSKVIFQNCTWWIGGKPINAPHRWIDMKRGE